MEGRSIPANQWNGFVDDFSREHEGEPVTLQLLDQQMGPTDLIENVPLLGISFDQEGSCTLELAAGTEEGEYIRHVIGKPKAIRVATDDDDFDAALEIEPDQGPTMLLLLKGDVQ
jgi:Family of unknown function (DUF5335)